MKTDAIKSYLTNTLRRVLRPLIRIALRGQLTHKEFADIAKLAFFDVARDDFGIDGRKTNLARVAILTGLSRKECTRLKQLEASGSVAPQTMSPATRVITAWHEDDDFRDQAGRPRTLAMDDDETSPGIGELFRRYAGDIPPGALLTELKRIGAVEQVDNGRWRVVKRSFIAKGFDRDKIRILGNQLSDLGTTIVHNLGHDVDEPRMQRYVVVDAIGRDDAREFQQLATQKGQALLEELDAWLTARTKPRADGHPDKHAQRVGLGVYYFQEPAPSGETK